jgi:EmrB/QacA subfamily drug resistance transporter
MSDISRNSNESKSPQIAAADLYDGEPAAKETSGKGSLGGSLFATGVIAFLGLLLETVLNVLFPALMSDFGISMGQVQWMTSGYLLVVSIIMPLSSFLNRRFTFKALFLFSTIALLIGVLVSAVAPNFTVLLIGRLIQSFGAGISTPLMFNIIAEQAPRQNLGRFMGIGALVIAIAPAVGPTMGGVFDEFLSWRWAFIAVIPFVLISMAVGMRSIRQSHPLEKVSLNTASLILLVLGFTCLIFGFEQGGALFGSSASALQITMVVALLVLAVIFLVAFVRVSQRAFSPLIRLGVLKSKAFRWSFIAFGLFQFASLGLGYVIPNFAQLGLGTSSLISGLIVVPGTIIGAIFAPLGGLVLDKFGAKRPILIGTAIALLGTVLFSVLGSSSSVIGLGAFYLIYMLGFGLAYANTQTYGLSNLPREFNSDGVALMNTLQQLAGSIGMTILSAIITVSEVGTKQGSKAFASATSVGAGWAFTVIAAVVLIALGVEFAAHKKRGTATPDAETVRASEAERVERVSAKVAAVAAE